ncbi:MAG TPA: DUF99 family protein [Candidatus Nanopusillus sp.]|nr:DUF99 family protein [Candidatus Nanopusillus sp.]
MYNKREIRVIGIDDGFFIKHKHRKTILVGVIMRGAYQLDGVLSIKITVDGLDVTNNIIKMIMRSTHYYQLRIIMLNGVTFAGFNIVDLEKLYNILGLPVIVVIRKKPNLPEFKKAIMHLDDWKKRWKLIEKLEQPKPINTKYGVIYYQKVGISDDDAKNIIKRTAINSRIPEPVRVAHLIAMGVTKGYSRGKV